MTAFNRLRILRQKMGADSASWGALAILAGGVIILVGLMVFYARA